MFETSLVRRTATPATFNNVVNRFFHDPIWGVGALSTPLGGRPAGWTPSVDIVEEEEAFLFAVDLPGLGKDDIDVTFEDNVLTLSGERSADEDTEKNGYRRRERSFGRFSRQFSLPSHVEAGKVSAKFKDGVLEVRVPKSEASRAQKIKVS